ncbi:SWIM zinc finger family protein [Bacillaceae bacterium W0354]
MKLIDFEEYIEDVILERGYNYFFNDHVEKIHEKYDSYFVVDVTGTNDYTVEIELSEDDTILRSTCDCPYDWGDYCKHEVAALYAIKELLHEPNNIKTTEAKQNKLDLKEILSDLSKDQLIQIILNITSEYQQLEKEIFFQFSSTEDLIASSKKLIREYINLAKYRGFIEWNKTYDAVYGANLTLDKARKKIDHGKEEMAVYLGLTVLPIVVDMLEYSDDSSGYLGMTINESLEIINTAIASGLNSFDEAVQHSLFQTIMKEANHKRYDDWEEWRTRLLESCTYFCKDDAIRESLEHHIQKLLSRESTYPTYDEYVKTKFRLLQLKIIELWDDEEQIIQFINQYIQHPAFREKAVLYYLNKEEYKKVVVLCKEADKQEKRHFGQASIWKKYQMQAYEGLEDLDSQRKVALELLYQNDYSYYEILKNLYQPDEWDKVLEKIITNFEKKLYLPSVYVKILIAEKLYKKLLEYCRSNVKSITSYYEYLIKDYSEEVEILFRRNIEQIAKEASQRSHYRKVCHEIRTYKKTFGNDYAQPLINELKQIYKRRPAFVDELSKIKLK